ncbi:MULTISPECIES: efflux RND transporter periplasmic adaptor subunit [Clostridium]|uniref:efflux RND transporter periplasmic adaptor subunit n=1 Tax=Clostridium TaxID=1485 RepID=UPI00098C9615|nr:MULTISPECIES: efflux RND transporter periplasmic adaptor subunit [Clostridium]NRT80722.1 multidrug efflux pump subunit AcrA (membrane-fusion protein) [Clostridium beijerinckii]OOM47536.1 multidrug resistance protein MdtA precursor [Clostridium beijerinckii]
MKNVKKIVIYAVVVAVVVGGIFVVKSKLSASKKVKATQVSVNKTAVEVQTVKTVEKNTGDTYKASIEAIQQGTVTSKIAAKIVSVSVENGQYVNAGDTIATLDDQDIQNSIKTAQAQITVYEKQVEAAEQSLNSSQIALQKYKINVDDAQRNYDRQKQLFDSKAISQTDLEAAEKTLNSAKADYDSGNASIQSAQATIETNKANLEVQKVTLAKNQSDLANTVIKSPISGVISGKSMNVGQIASSGTALATINDISSVYATIQVPQEKIGGIQIGQSATVTVDGNDKTYDGTVQSIDLSADATTRVFNCKIKIDNSDKSLYPGVYGKAELLTSNTTEIITVPITALVGSEGDYSVFINNNGKATKQKVTVGQTDENNVEITEGMKEGDQVIWTNTATLHDGDEIEVVSSENNSEEETTDKNGNNAEAAYK